MIHRYIFEFNVEQNHAENDQGRFFDYLNQCFASQSAKLELIHKSQLKPEIVSVLVTPKNEVIKTKLKTIEQQLASLKKK